MPTGRPHKEDNHVSYRLSQVGVIAALGSTIVTDTRRSTMEPREAVVSAEGNKSATVSKMGKCLYHGEQRRAEPPGEEDTYENGIAKVKEFGEENFLLQYDGAMMSWRHRV
ncbi:hypothetical protein AXG93_4773s1010 [Marchantia polymorpha subsp. ruderalis]|uniref:Uncharacterized protein n=1 Tax=Marchantia polymorpha subsp. ruderalis TaxID=1480154 RepID=A0A176WIU1_MARPO|nr:hypothetical protein AXG93_4773s1010 [Marchantia polymorpha subsp. ruderalis]